MRLETVKLSKIKSNPNNPRLIKDYKFKKLVESIKTFPEMIELREIVVDENYIVLGGNMRLKAMLELGIKETIVKVADGLTDEQKKEFLIKDNANFGEFDFDILANEWSEIDLDNWGVDIPKWETETDYSDKNKEIDTDEFSDKMTLKLEFSQNEYTFINNTLSRINANKEIALLELLNYES